MSAIRRVRSRADVGRLASATARPGNDPRVWLTLAVVKELGFDAEEGLFADVQYQPSGDFETALVSGACAGSRFGSWRPLAIDDTVLVAVPMGDPGHGPVIISRLWNAGDPPPEDFGSGQDPSEDWIDILGPDKHYILKTSGNGQIKLQAATQSFVRGEDLADAINNFLDAMNIWIGLVASGITAGGGTLDNTVFIQAIEALQRARDNYLSTKIKGE